MSNALPTRTTATKPYELQSEAPMSAGRRQALAVMTIGPGYFHTIGATLIAGRDVTDRDDAAGEAVAIVNTRLASTVWPGQDAVGKRLWLLGRDAPGAWLTVVVVSNIAQNDPTLQQVNPVIYVPYRQNPSRFMWVYARTHTPAAGLAPLVRREMASLDPDPPDFDPQPCGSAVRELSRRRDQRRGVRGVRRDRPASGGRRTLCRRRACGRPAHAGDRHQDGAWRERPRDPRAHLRAGHGAGRHRARDRHRGCPRADAGARVPARSCIARRPDRVCRGIHDFDRLRGAGMSGSRRALRIDPVIALRHD